jgi:GAF domain-containing protein
MGSMTDDRDARVAEFEAELAALTAERDVALDRQSATAEILHVIATSPTDLQHALQSTAQTALRIVDAHDVGITQPREGELQVSATAMSDSLTPEQRERYEAARRGRTNASVNRDSVRGRAFVDRQAVQFVLRDDSVMPAEFPSFYMVRIGPSAHVAVPLLRDGEPLGVLALYRYDVRPFSERQIALLETFAAQAVIAIVNTLLSEELRERTAQLARSVGELQAFGEVGQAVSSSLDLPTVLTTIVANATRLAGADGGIVYEYDDTNGIFVLRASHQTPDDLVAVLQSAQLRLGEGVVGRARLGRHTRLATSSAQTSSPRASATCCSPTAIARCSRSRCCARTTCSGAWSWLSGYRAPSLPTWSPWSRPPPSSQHWRSRTDDSTKHSRKPRATSRSSWRT